MFISHFSLHGPWGPVAVLRGFPAEQQAPGFPGWISAVSSLFQQQLSHAVAASIILSSVHALGMKSSTLVCTSSFITCPRFLKNRDIPVQFSSSFIIPKKFVQVFLTDFFYSRIGGIFQFRTSLSSQICLAKCFCFQF